MRQKEASSRVGKNPNLYFSTYIHVTTFSKVSSASELPKVFFKTWFSAGVQSTLISKLLWPICCLLDSQRKKKKSNREGTHSDQEKDGETQWF